MPGGGSDSFGFDVGSIISAKASVKKVGTKQAGGGKKASVKKAGTKQAGGGKKASVKKAGIKPASGSKKASTSVVKKKQDERRIDPTDGKPYTAAEFRQHYGGIAQWDAAKNGSVRKGSTKQAPVVQRQPQRIAIRTQGEYQTEYAEYLRLHRVLRTPGVCNCDNHGNVHSECAKVLYLLKIIVGLTGLILDLWVIISFLQLITKSVGDSTGGTIWMAGTVLVYCIFMGCFLAAYEDRGGKLTSESDLKAGREGDDCWFYMCVGGSSGKLCYKGAWGKYQNTIRALNIWMFVKLFLVCVPVVYFVTVVGLQVDPEEDCEPLNFGDAKYTGTTSDKNEQWTAEFDAWEANREPWSGGNMFQHVAHILRNDLSAPKCTSENKTAGLLRSAVITASVSAFALAMAIVQWIGCCITYPKRASAWKQSKPRLVAFESRHPRTDHGRSVIRLDLLAELCDTMKLYPKDSSAWVNSVYDV